MNKLGIYENLSTECDNDNAVEGAYVDRLLRNVKGPSIRENKLVLLLKKASRNTKQGPTNKVKISRKEKQKLNLLKVQKTGWNYEEFEPLRKMWLEYMISYLNLRNHGVPDEEDKYWSNFHVKLGKADYHGSEMIVVRSKCPSLVGISGTCILDTKNTFKILSKDNKARTVPKKYSIFKLKITNLEITIYGKYFASRPADRSVKHTKISMVLDL